MSDDLSSKQSTALFRSTKKAHRVCTGTMSMEQTSRRNQSRLCGMHMWRPRYVITIFYIIRSINTLVHIFREILQCGPFVTRVGTILHKWRPLSQCLARKDTMLLQQLRHLCK